MNDVQSFLPIVNEHSRVLILGSAPGEMSLKYQQYYAHPRNQFWKLIFALLGEREIPADYEQKVQFLLRHGIALWDVIANCERGGSLDANIKNEEPNDFKTFFEVYPSIACIAFNGSKSHEVFHKKVAYKGPCALIKLPSSSPARTTSFETKLEEWMLLGEYVF